MAQITNTNTTTTTQIGTTTNLTYVYRPAAGALAPEFPSICKSILKTTAPKLNTKLKNHSIFFCCKFDFFQTDDPKQASFFLSL